MSESVTIGYFAPELCRRASIARAAGVDLYFEASLAKSSALTLCLSLSDTSALCSRRTRTTLTCPSITAIIRGVSPSIPSPNLTRAQLPHFWCVRWNVRQIGSFRPPFSPEENSQAANGYNPADISAPQSAHK
jgi:hypothetical protein